MDYSWIAWTAVGGAAIMLPFAIRLEARRIRRERVQLESGRAEMPDAAYLSLAKVPPQHQAMCALLRTGISLTSQVSRELIFPDDLLCRYARLQFGNRGLLEYAKWICVLLNSPLSARTIKRALADAGGKTATVGGFCVRCAEVAETQRLRLAGLSGLE